MSETAAQRETYYGFVRQPRDALLLFEACRTGHLSMVTRRLTDAERGTLVKSGAVFVWDEEDSGIKRWTDGRNWSPSRIHGSFLVYQEIEPRRFRTGGSDAQAISEAAKENGLVKKAISITLTNNRKQHLVSYYSKKDIGSLPVPSEDSQLTSVVAVDPSMYPESAAALDDANQPQPDSLVLNTPWQRQQQPLKRSKSLASDHIATPPLAHHHPDVPQFYPSIIQQQQQQQQQQQKERSFLIPPGSSVTAAPQTSLVSQQQQQVVNPPLSAHIYQRPVLPWPSHSQSLQKYTLPPLSGNTQRLPNKEDLYDPPLRKPLSPPAPSDTGPVFITHAKWQPSFVNPLKRRIGPLP